ncbi:MAG: glycosyltransferase family 4 protein [Rhodopseudomonas palustris]|uniref:Glycosyltransferase family 4 protein n=1 Tax=Rhodopseudomonas palustris TaxID=1076 RepID=A0A933RUJ7_RHOPL|nr:glycosyltransferase family 4 protein [Rhodopseudomonas palustris]
MGIALSANFIRPGRVGGVEQAFYNLVLGLLDCGANTTIVGGEGRLARGMKENLVARGAIVDSKAFVNNRFLAEEMFAATESRDFVGTVFPNYYLPMTKNRRLGTTITIVHDLQHLHFPQNFSLAKRLWLEKCIPHALRASDIVVCISDATRVDVEANYGAGRSRIVTIPNAVDWSRLEIRDGGAQPETVEHPYVLSVAHHFAHKNLDTLIRAVGEISKTRDDLKLVLVGQLSNALGSGSYSNRLTETIREGQLENVVRFTGLIDDATLGRLYRSAAVFCSPSLFEGFGLPAVEAIGLGVPTIVSGIESLKEVTLGRAEYVSNPLSVDEWSARISRAIEDPKNEHDRQLDAARVRAAYSRSVIAQKYLSLLGAGNKGTVG